MDAPSEAGCPGADPQRGVVREHTPAMCLGHQEPPAAGIQVEPHSLLSRGQCGARFQDLTSVLGAGLMEGKRWWKRSCREVSPVHPFMGRNNLQQGLGVLVYSPAKWGEE